MIMHKEHRFTTRAHEEYDQIKKDKIKHIKRGKEKKKTAQEQRLEPSITQYRDCNRKRTNVPQRKE